MIKKHCVTTYITDNEKELLDEIISKTNETKSKFIRNVIVKNILHYRDADIIAHDFKSDGETRSNRTSSYITVNELGLLDEVTEKVGISRAEFIRLALTTEVNNKKG